MLSEVGTYAVYVFTRGLRADDTDYFSAQKDGKRQDEKTLLEHYCCVLNNNKVINPEEADECREMHSILSILALLPIGGISSEDFDSVAYPYSKRSKIIIDVIIDITYAFCDAKELIKSYG